jgi:hypothetical protein
MVDNAIVGCRLLLQENGSPFNHENKPYGGTPIFKITTPIRITISKNFLGWRYTEL